jgi:glycosyltransferase involved in cell wall biosynthesis
LDVHFHGFASQNELPSLYQSARVFLFPTQADVWGIVANEACAAGLPVLVTPFAGVAGELVVDGRNGFVRELNIDEWSARAAQLLDDGGLWRSFSLDSLARVRRYHFDSAAQGIVDACACALSTVEPKQPPVARRQQ